MIDKIRKLLALSTNNSNEEEAASAMAMARALMLKHGIEDQDLIEEAKPGVEYSGAQKASPWQLQTGWAAATLSGVELIKYAKAGSCGFLGRPENNQMAFLLWDWINQQVESFYKAALLSGLTQKERSNFRKSFKWACSGRIVHRVQQIVKQDEPEHKSFALVLVNEIEARVEEDGLKKGKPAKHEVKDLNAAMAGRAAGDQVKLTQELSQ